MLGWPTRPKPKDGLYGQTWTANLFGGPSSPARGRCGPGGPSP